jgi:hypothetical protein
MKDGLRIFFIPLVTVLALQFFHLTSTDAQASGEEYHLKILEALKRINVRLIRTETKVSDIEKKLQETSVQKVSKALEDQNKKLRSVMALFKTDLIPALDSQSEYTRSSLLTELSQGRVIDSDKIEKINSRIGEVSVGNDLMNEKLSRLIDILKSFAVEQVKIDKHLQKLSSKLINK